MSELDYLKEKVSFNKFLLGFLLAFVLSVGGWISGHYNDKSLILVCAVIAEIVVGISILILLLKTSKIIRKMKDI